MFKKSLRLTKREIKLFFNSKPRYTKGGYVVLRYLKNKKPHSRFAFIVSGPKKFAVGRNLARRRMSEAVELVYNKIPPGYDLVFFLKLVEKKVPTFKLIKEETNNVLNKSNL